MKSPQLSIAGLFAAFLLLTCFSHAGSIHDAAADGNVERVSELLDANPDLANVADEQGDNPLHCAVRKGQAAVIKLLLTRRADVNAKGAFDATPLHLAARHGHASVVELLLANKADVNAQAIEGGTPLQLAVFYGHESVVRLLSPRQIGSATPMALSILLTSSTFRWPRSLSSDWPTRKTPATSTTTVLSS